MTTIAYFIAELEKTFGAVARRIKVDIDPETGRKLCHGEKNNLTQEQIAADRGSGNTWSIALKCCPGLVCVDFDQKDLDTCELWQLLVERDCLRVETTKGWHVYVKTDAIDNCKEIGVGGQFAIDLLVKQRNVWETCTRVLTGSLQDVPWVCIEEHLDFTAKRPTRKRECVVETECGIPTEIERWLTDKFSVGKVTVKQDTRLKKVKQGARTVITEQIVTCTSICVGCEACPAGGKHTNHQYVDCCRDEQGELFSVSLRCTSPTCEFDSKDRTAEALNYEQCIVWNDRVAYIEAIPVYMYTAPGRESVQVMNDRHISNTMAFYSTLSLNDWLAHPDSKRYHDIGFYPKLDPTPKQFDPRDYNLFRGFRITRDKAVDGDCTPLLNHIHTVLCAGNREYSEFFLNCLAQIVQTPWKKLNTATVLISEEGAGKTILFQHFMGKILGSQCFLSESRSDALFGNFNSVLSGKLLVVAEELLWAGSHKDAGILKDLLTSDTLSINAKFQQPHTEQNFVNMFILTNNSWAIQAGMQARRFFVLRPSDKFSGKQTVEAREYFDKLLSVDPAAFAHHLYTRDLTNFNSRQPPLTDALIDQKKQSMSPVESMLFECLQREYVLVRQNDKLFHDPMPRMDVFTELKSEFGQLRNFPSSPQNFWAEMKRALTDKHGDCLLVEMYGGNRTTVDGQRDRFVCLPGLDECRKWWCTHKFIDDWGGNSVAVGSMIPTTKKRK
jgi:hypothetical protein